MISTPYRTEYIEWCGDNPNLEAYLSPGWLLTECRRETLKDFIILNRCWLWYPATPVANAKEESRIKVVGLPRDPDPFLDSSSDPSLETSGFFADSMLKPRVNEA